MREWTALFTSGNPLYEPEAEEAEEMTPTPEQILEEERQQLLDEGDFNEYRVWITNIFRISLLDNYNLSEIGTVVIGSLNLHN